MAEVKLADYDPSWARRYDEEAALLAAALRGRARQIEHVGSTAVPGLAAKPTIDIAVGVDSLEMPADAVERIEQAGYVYQEDAERPWERRFVRGEGFPREVIVHFVEWQGWKWREFLRFRDALLGDPGLAAEYEELKRSLLQRGHWYRGVDKRELIERVLAE